MYIFLMIDTTVGQTNAKLYCIFYLLSNTIV